MAFSAPTGRHTLSRHESRRSTKWKDELKEISPGDLADIRRVFTMYDVNKDGTITMTELLPVMQMLGNNPTPKYMRQIMKEADKDGNGKLDFDEFALLISKYLKPKVEEEMELVEAFAVFDKDDSGSIEISELKEILKIANERLSDKVLNEIFEELDINGDGRLDYKEFTKIATKSSFKDTFN